jgi:hypothetical protein
MKIRKKAFCFGIMVMFAALFSSAAYADLYWETETVSNGVPHQQSGTVIEKHYFTSSAYRLEAGDGKIMIMNYDLMKSYTLNPQTKTYTEVDLNQMPEMMRGMNKEQMDKMMEGMEMKVTPTSETKTIAGYKCTRYMVDFAMVHGEYWVSKDVKGSQELKAVAAKLGKAAQNNPMLRHMNIASMVERFDGFPVQTTSKMMGGTIVNTLKKVEQQKINPELFRVPGDYTLKSGH